MTRAAIARPDVTEYAPAYGPYVGRVPEDDLLAVLEQQRHETQGLLASLPEGKALYRYAPGKWSIKEVIGHLMDCERVFAYRALRFARGDQTPLSGFDEKLYAPAGTFDARPLTDLAAELDTVRQATIALFGGLDADVLARHGRANDREVSVRALGYIIAGHERHHVAILRDRYLG
ncbi:MAG TPA: DinB family protein [Gemmatimonadales bacterium]|jgi:hypothetical protein|nr:DinB family protein [Gemmatimonadales bacterium]